MKLFILVLLLTSVLIPQPAAFAGGDEIELKDGSTLKGDVITRNALQIYLSTKDEGVIRVDLSDIRTIRFGPATPKILQSNRPDLPIQEQAGNPG